MAEKIICVVGPTACGKTKLGVLLAKRYDGEVVSADSMQIYKGMTIGTAAPTAEEMEGVPHHMIAVADPAEQWSAARYARAAVPIVDDILRRGKRPILVGGTGLWLDAVVQGRTFAGGHAGGAVRRELQAQLAREGIGPLLEELRQVDPEAAERLHPADEKRILRALEVYRETGKTISAHNAETRDLPPRYDAVWIGLQFRDRADMKTLIDRRVDAMVAAGLLEEVGQLLESGLPREATALQAIGYKEFLGVLDGTATVEEAVAEVKLRSRQYAKRQLTWLRRNPDIHWIWWEKDRDFDGNPGRRWRILAVSGRETGKSSDSYRKKERTYMQTKANLQDLFLLRARRDKLPVTMFLMNGFQMRGTIAGFDAFVVVLDSDGRQQIIYKHAISTIAPVRPVDLEGEEPAVAGA